MGVPAVIFQRRAQEIGCGFCGSVETEIEKIYALDVPDCEIQPSAGTLFIAAASGAVPKGFDAPVVTAEGAPLACVWNKMNDVLAANWRIETRIAALYQHIRDMDLDEAARRLGDAAGCSVLILDAYCRIAGLCGGDGMSHAEAESLAMRMLDANPSGKRPTCASAGRMFACATVFDGGRHVGYVLFAFARGGYEADLAGMHISSASALLSLSQRLRLHGRAVTTEQLIASIMDGRIKDAEFIRSAAEKWGWKRHGHYFLLAAESDGKPQAEIKAAMQEALGAEVFLYRNYYLAITTCAANEQYMPEEGFINFLKTNRLHSVLSNTLEDFAAIRRAFRQCLAILDMRGRMGEPKYFVRFQEQVAMYLIDTAATNGVDITALCYQPVLQIMKYDEEHGTRYLQTLISFLGRNMNIEKTGSVLYEHRNTAYKKIKYIRETFNLDLGSFATQFKIHITICALYYLNKIDRKSVNSVMWDDVVY